MPGTRNSSSPQASFITEFALHRAGLTAADNTSNPALVLTALDITRNLSAHSNQIWIGVVRTAGTGTIDITIFRKETGTWFAIAPWTQEGTQATMATGTIKKFTGLPAGEYRVLITNITGGSTWSLHEAHSL